MSISSTTRKAGPYTGNGSTTGFPFSFKVFSGSDVLVVRTDPAGVESNLVLGTDYTVVLNADQDANPGGTITATTAPATGYLITATSRVQNLQPVTLTNQGAFYPKVINDAFDRLTILVQQVAEQVGRAVKVSISSTLAPDQLISSINAAVSSTAASASAASGSASTASSAATSASNSATLAANNAASVNFTNVDFQKQTYVAFPTGGTSTAFTLTPSPATTSNAAKQRFNSTFHTAPGASPTLAVSGLTALPLKYYDSTGTLQAITASQFGANFVGDVVSDGTNWIVLNAPGVPAKSVKGTSTNDSAAAGYVGEYIESFVGPVNAPASNTFGDLTSIALTAGDWDISAILSSLINTGTSITSVTGGVGTAPGTSGAGLLSGDTQGYSVPPTTQYLPSITIPPKRVSLAATTTYYLKMWMSYGGGTPQFQGRISARRVR